MIQTLCSFFTTFVRFWESLYSIQVWEFPAYLQLSLPSGLSCVMSYLMQTDKQCAGTDSIKETQWGTHMGGLGMHLQYTHTHSHTSAHTHTWFQHFGRRYHSQSIFYCIVWSKAIHSIPHLHALQHNLARWALKKISSKTSVSSRSTIRCVTFCQMTCYPLA